MLTDDIDRLRRLAVRASQGKRQSVREDIDCGLMRFEVVSDQGVTIAAVSEGTFNRAGQARLDADYLAAIDPGTLLELLDIVEEKTMTDDVPTTQCPRCGAWVDDYDGFGVLAHTAPAYADGCGYCSHPARDGGVCGICGDEERAKI